MEERSADGAISSAQRALFAASVVPAGEEGARMLSSIYWREVERSTRGLVQALSAADGVVLGLPLHGPALLRFGQATLSVCPTGISCCHEIVGGLLARRAAGTIKFEQRPQDGQVLVISAIAGFYPTLAARPGAPAWTGELYKRVQSRVHIAVARRYFARLAQRVAG